MTLHEGTTGGHFQAFQAPSCAAFMGIISKHICFVFVFLLKILDLC